MRWKDYGIIFISLLLCCGLLYWADSRQDPIRKAREEMGLVMNPALENAPPSLAFATVAMGAFRGLVVDILWMRADKLKQDGQFFDARQLAEWITMLQPRFAAVWDFHAWNMAYNISVAIPNTQCQERWRWVKNGLELLRDKAIPLNPKSIILYRQLSWIFLHKIGDISDDCHRFYKSEMAMSVRSMLGENTNAIFEDLIAAPRTLEEAMADPEISQWVSALRAADPVFERDDKLAENYLSLRQNPDRYSQIVKDTLAKFKDTPGLKRFDSFARAAQIRQVWKMDVAYMHQLNKKYGPVRFEDPNTRDPLNWEHPAVHAIYWSAKGLELAGRPDQYRVDEKNTDRIIFHGLQQLYRGGSIILYAEKDGRTSIFLRPDVRMFDSCDQTWKMIIEKYESLEKGNPKAVRGGHKNFLENAVLTFYQAGHINKALTVYNDLRTRYPNDEQGYAIEDYKLPMAEFAKKRLQEEFQGLGIQDATEFIIMALQESYFRYAIGQDTEAANRETIANQAYQYYQSQRGLEEQGRVGLESMERIRYVAFIDFLNDPRYPEELRLALLGRIQAERPDVFEKIQQQESLLREQNSAGQPQ